MIAEVSVVVQTRRMSDLAGATAAGRGTSRAALRGAVGLAVVLAVVTLPFAAWWLIGDQSTVPLSDDPDYTVRPPHINPSLARDVGIVSVALFVAAIAFALYATQKRWLGGRWWAVIGPLLLVGVIAAFGERLVTAGVIGANIGAGFVVFLGVPVVVAAIAWAVTWSFRLRRRSGVSRAMPSTWPPR